MLHNLCVLNESYVDPDLAKKQCNLHKKATKWREKCSNTEFFSGPHFPVFGLNTGKYEPEKTLYLDSFHSMQEHINLPDPI